MPHYFNNKSVENLIKHYLEEEENLIKKQQLREEIMGHVKDVVNGIIFRHKFTAFDNYDDLMQEAMLASVVALDRFDPNKGTAFNYFSLVAKKALTYYTLKNKKNRNNHSIDDFTMYLSANTEITDFDIENLVNQLRCYFKESKLKRLQPLNDILENYLKKKRRFNKRDFFRFAKSFGFSQNLIRKYLKILHSNKDEVYKIYFDRGCDA